MIFQDLWLRIYCCTEILHKTLKNVHTKLPNLHVSFKKFIDWSKKCSLLKIIKNDLRRQYILKVMAQLQVLYSECLDQYLVGRIQIKSPPTIFSLASWFWREPEPIVLCSIFPPSYWDQTNTIKRQFLLFLDAK